MPGYSKRDVENNTLLQSSKVHGTHYESKLTLIDDKAYVKTFVVIAKFMMV